MRPVKEKTVKAKARVEANVMSSTEAEAQLEMIVIVAAADRYLQYYHGSELHQSKARSTTTRSTVRTERARINNNSEVSIEVHVQKR
jgi:hypothetical protein